MAQTRSSLVDEVPQLSLPTSYHVPRPVWTAPDAEVLVELAVSDEAEDVVETSVVIGISVVSDAELDCSIVVVTVIDFVSVESNEDVFENKTIELALMYEEFWKCGETKGTVRLNLANLCFPKSG